jgi:hypothetical protein
MSIVSDKNVSDALAYLAGHPHPVALARKDLTDAENEAERIWAIVYGEQQGSIKDKEAAADRDPRVVAAKKAIADAQCEYEAHRARIRAADMLLEIYRTENANARAAERIR